MLATFDSPARAVRCALDMIEAARATGLDIRAGAYRRGTRRAGAADENREREIAQLAADGLPSRVIAERLFVSVRTVDNHLARIYTKLGVTSRSELPAVLGR